MGRGRRAIRGRLADLTRRGALRDAIEIASAARTRSVGQETPHFGDTCDAHGAHGHEMVAHHEAKEIAGRRRSLAGKYAIIAAAVGSQGTSCALTFATCAKSPRVGSGRLSRFAFPSSAWHWVVTARLSDVLIGYGLQRRRLLGAPPEVSPHQAEGALGIRRRAHIGDVLRRRGDRRAFPLSRRTPMASATSYWVGRTGVEEHSNT